MIENHIQLLLIKDDDGDVLLMKEHLAYATSLKPGIFRYSLDHAETIKEGLSLLIRS